jgi:hypothetical protein
MQDNTTKTLCSHHRFKRIGGRRKRCLDCGKSWSVRARKRGRKPTKRRVSGLAKTFVDKLTLVQQSRRSGMTSDVLSKRHAQTLEILCDRPWPHTAPEGPLILVMDAMWFDTVLGKQTVYLLGLRAVHDNRLHFLRPVLRPGHESQKRWREVLGKIPEEARKRIHAFVSDSFAGSGRLAKEHGWVFQRCQAHLLLRLSTLCGDNKRVVSWREGRQETQRLMRALMNVRDESEASEIADRLFVLGQDKRCPARLRHIIVRTLRTLREYRACYLHPELRLPATTNALENTNGRIRSLLNRSRGCRTPESLIRWITGFLWFHPMVACRPKSDTEIKR